MVTYKLYSRLPTEGNITSTPSFDGFSVIGLQQPANAQSTMKKLTEKNIMFIHNAIAIISITIRTSKIGVYCDG
ncbi:MAG: hypothetical protein WDM71_11370 [Ferruginibacter sp.]